MDAHRAAALRVFTALCEARKRLRPQSRLRPSYQSLAGIAGRLEAGKTEAECLHVVAVAESECRADMAAFQWFDAVSPWRPENFERRLGREPGDVSAPRPNGAPATASRARAGMRDIEAQRRSIAEVRGDGEDA